MVDTEESVPQEETIPLRIIGARDGKGSVLRDRDFRPSPFLNTTWEYVGPRCEVDGFLPVRVPVLEMPGSEPDSMFQVFDKERPQVASILHTAGPDRFRQEGDDVVEVPSISDAELEQALVEQFEAGRQAGFEEGQAAAKQELQGQVAEVRSRFEQVSAAVKQSLERFYARTEAESVHLALLVARKILETTVEARPEYIVEVIHKALAQLGAGKPQRILISPQDYEFMLVIGLPPEISAEELGVEYVVDESIRSGCVVESDFGSIEVELDKMWEQVRGELFAATRG